MKYLADSVVSYIEQLPEERKSPIEEMRKTINTNIPSGFEEGIIYDMIGWYVPHSKYPDGYHCDPQAPLPFMNLASQKNFIAIYHNGIYAKKELLDWFVSEYPNHCKRKLDMGKCCVRFKYMDDIPYELIGELCRKTTVDEWIEIYERKINL